MQLIISTRILGTSGQIAASAATGTVTLSLPAALTGINSIASTAATALNFGVGATNYFGITSGFDITIKSTAQLGFSSGAVGAGNDCGFARQSAGVIGVTNGAGGGATLEMLGTNALQFGATAAAIIAVSADTTSGILNISGTNAGADSAACITFKAPKYSRSCYLSNAGTFVFNQQADVTGAGLLLNSTTNAQLLYTGLTFSAAGTSVDCGVIRDAASIVRISDGSTGFSTVRVATVAVKSGANLKAGTFTLVAGTVTVTNTSVTANSVIMCSVKTVGGTPSVYEPVATINAGVGFTMTGLATDTSTYNFVILEVN